MDVDRKQASPPTWVSTSSSTSALSGPPLRSVSAVAALTCASSTPTGSTRTPPTSTSRLSWSTPSTRPSAAMPVSTGSARVSTRFVLQLGRFGRNILTRAAPREPWPHLDRQEVPWHQPWPSVQQHLWRSSQDLEAPEHHQVLEIPLNVRGLSAGVAGDYGCFRLCLSRSKVDIAISLNVQGVSPCKNITGWSLHFFCWYNGS